MREAKYQNELGTNIGKWYLNRLDYFQFHHFTGMARYKLLALASIVCGIYLIKHLPILLAPLPLYSIYIGLLSLVILQKRICKWKGYFLYPKRFIENLKLYRIETEVNDFDSLATMERAGASQQINQYTATQAHLRGEHLK